MNKKGKCCQGGKEMGDGKIIHQQQCWSVTFDWGMYKAIEKSLTFHQREKKKKEKGYDFYF